MTFYERIEIGMQSVPEGMIVGLGVIAVLCLFKAIIGPIQNHSKPMEHKVVGRLIEHDGFNGKGAEFDNSWLTEPNSVSGMGLDHCDILSPLTYDLGNDEWQK